MVCVVSSFVFCVGVKIACKVRTPEKASFIGTSLENEKKHTTGVRQKNTPWISRTGMNNPPTFRWTGLNRQTKRVSCTVAKRKKKLIHGHERNGRFLRELESLTPW